MILTAVLSGIDLWCKSYVEKNFQKGRGKEILNGKIILRKVHNEGMAFNIGEEYPHVVKWLSGIMCGILSMYSAFVWIQSKSSWKKIGTSLVLAGAISNTYDRFVRKYVVDYFGFKTKWEKFGRITFNLGDIFIFLGGIVMFFVEIIGSKK